ncbi:RluA family pseudouridine synthase [Caldichromatium japonicum]|uniref:Pseudouridine synthase n=1 Tax=Caldichromatium japonicum TaxID=2699430 RepID=A0A6G7VC37_9GAMM|nr:RluA family pseudouridine synthase [Caldichromatium japonicum]QIK37470.1 RluA family pseudouridine synthase [Caldichromatium japonicum]
MSTAVQYIVVDAEAEGQRIDNFLRRVLKGVPPSHLYRLLRRGEVRVNQGRVRADHRLCAGDEVRIPPVRLGAPLPPPEHAPHQLAWLERAILHEDERLLIIDKPAGLAVHGGSGLSFGLIESLRLLRPGCELELVHRLDRETSGCLVVCKRRSTLRELHALIREGRMEKRYLALLVGELPRSTVLVEAPLKKNVLASGERMVQVDHQSGKPARTRLRRLARFMADDRALTLAEAELLTGRTHQIRVHAAHLGLPLAGDPKYGDEAANRCLKARGLARLFLHAVALGFQLSSMSQPLRIEAPVPAALRGFLDTLGARS